MTQSKGWQAKAANKLAVARAYVKQYAVYFSPTLYGMIPTPVEGLRELVGGPMGVTEHLVLLYEPAWVEAEEEIVLATGLAHECLHHQLKHIVRGKSYPDKKRWNRAGDLYINSTMREQQKQVRDGEGRVVKAPMWKFPDWALMPERFGFKPKLSADEYYRLLEEWEKKNPPPEIKHMLLCGGCGGVGGNPLSKELEQSKDEVKGRSEADCRSIARETAKAMGKYLSAHGGRGDFPGEWSELTEMSESVFDVPWRTELANVTRYSIGNVRTGGLDYSKRRQSKRSYLRGIPLPSLISYDPELLFIIDSSGSMGKEQLGDALKVCADVMQQTGIHHARFMEADAQAQRDPIRVTAHDLRSIEIRGRGGTDFRPAIEYAEKMRPRPHLVFYLTDGDGYAPKHPPANMHVIWVVVPSSWARRPALWGKTVVLSDTKVEILEPHIIEEDDDE